MGDGLRLSGGGSTAVATDDVFAEIARLGSVAAIVDGWRGRAERIRIGVDELAGVPAVIIGSSSSLLGFAAAALRRAVDEATALGAALHEAAERYGATERFLTGLWTTGHRLGAFHLGAMLPLLAGPALLVGGTALVGGAAARLVAGGDRADAALARVLADARHVLSDPAFVQLVAALASSGDELVAGLLRSPALLAAGSQLGAPEDAELLLAAVSLVALATGGRALVETGVAVRRVPPPQRGPEAASAAGVRAMSTGPGASAPAPRGIADLAARIPPSAPGEPQIRIERYGTADAPRWIVYSSGTVDFTAVPGAQTHDMTSNVHLVADAAAFDAIRAVGEERGAAERAMRDAMAAAGMEPGDPFLAVGHSAGGIGAANVASDPALHGVGAINFGGPTAQVDPNGTPLLSVEHDQDLVPSTAGTGRPSADRLVVHADVGDAIRGSHEAVPAHAMTLYRQTAADIDASDEARLRAWRDLVRDHTGEGVAEVTYWQAERMPPVSRASAGPPGR